MSTKEEPGPFDGLERAKPGEPVFPLRAHDPLAADLVQLWVDRKRALIARDRSLPDDKRALELIQAGEAETVAWAMRDWRAGVSEYPAPVATASPVPYSGHKTEADELAAKARFDAHRDAARRFDNAVAEMTEAVETLALYGFTADALDLKGAVRRAVDGAAGVLRKAAEAVRPKRASYAHRGGEQ